MTQQRARKKSVRGRPYVPVSAFVSPPFFFVWFIRSWYTADAAHWKWGQQLCALCAQMWRHRPSVRPSVYKSSPTLFFPNSKLCVYFILKKKKKTLFALWPAALWWTRVSRVSSAQLFAFLSDSFHGALAFAFAQLCTTQPHPSIHPFEWAFTSSSSFLLWIVKCKDLSSLPEEE